MLFIVEASGDVGLIKIVFILFFKIDFIDLFARKRAQGLAEVGLGGVAEREREQTLAEQGAPRPWNQHLS